VNNLNNSAPSQIATSPTNATSYDLTPFSPENISAVNNDASSPIPLTILAPRSAANAAARAKPMAEPPDPELVALLQSAATS
jgi:hypothetical protein